MKPPKFALNGKKWEVEHQVKEQRLCLIILHAHTPQGRSSGASSWAPHNLTLPTPQVKEQGLEIAEAEQKHTVRIASAPHSMAQHGLA